MEYTPDYFCLFEANERKKLLGRLFAMVLCGLLLASCTQSRNHAATQSHNRAVASSQLCVQPDFLHPGDKVAIVAPGYAAESDVVERLKEVLLSWGLTPVEAPNLCVRYGNKLGGTAVQRANDLKWALENPEVKAILCYRGGYGCLQLLPLLSASDLRRHPKWLIGYSDITTLHSLEVCAGVMSIHGTIGSAIAASGGTDTNSRVLRDLLMGQVPQYQVAPHPCNQKGTGTGVLVGGNLCSFSPLAGSGRDFTEVNDYPVAAEGQADINRMGFILFIEELDEPMRNMDRLFSMLRLRGVLEHCHGVILGDFTGCNNELGFESVEALFSGYLKEYNIPVCCGFPVGHGDINLPLIEGAVVTLQVNSDGSTLTFR